MYSLFRLLFQKAYWQMLLRKATWTEAWLNLKRAHKDKRARKHIGRLALLAATPGICLAYLAVMAGARTILLLPLIFGIVWWRRRQAKLERRSIRVTPGPEPVDRELTEDERRTMRRYFARLALLHGVMVDRASSEMFLKRKTLPEGFEVTSRRLHLALLKSHDIWERMAQADREAMMVADGHWDWELINRVALAMEPLRLLRWMLRLDFYLPLIGQHLQFDYTVSREIVDAPLKALDGDTLVGLPSLRRARDAAATFFNRCVAEGISRGYYNPKDDEGAEWAHRMSAALSGKQHEDLVLGDALVSEANEQDIRWATTLSHRRLNFLRWSMSLLNAATVPAEPFPCVSCE